MQKRQVRVWESVVRLRWVCPSLFGLGINRLLPRSKKKLRVSCTWPISCKKKLCLFLFFWKKPLCIGVGTARIAMDYHSKEAPFFLHTTKTKKCIRKTNFSRHDEKKTNRFFVPKDVLAWRYLFFLGRLTKNDFFLYWTPQKNKDFFFKRKNSGFE